MEQERNERKEKLEKTLDWIIKIVLVIIIILLLLHNCELIRRGKKLNGNGDVIEIRCDSNGQCDDGKDKDNPKTGDEGKSGSGKYGTSTTGKQAGGTSSSKKGTKPSKKDSGKEDEEEDEPEEFTVFDKKVTWGNTTVVDIFEKPIYGYNRKIAPGDHNAYKFTVKNLTKYNLKYDMTFDENNDYQMDLRYKLKKNGSYVISNYVTYDQLDLTNQLIDSKSSDVYILEWKWLGDESDSTGKDNKDKAAAGVATYKLKIKIEAESING